MCYIQTHRTILLGHVEEMKQGSAHELGVEEPMEKISPTSPAPEPARTDILVLLK